MRTTLRLYLVAVSTLALFGVVGAATDRPVAPPSAAAGAAPLVGLWTRYVDARADGDLVRFYFFHEDGIGLYRFGKIGLNTTNSFTWRVERSDRGDELVLRFNKTGRVERSRVVVEERAGRRQLTLLDDPKEPLERRATYTFVPPPQQAIDAPDLFGDDDVVDDGHGDSEHGDHRASANPVAGRLWIDLTTYATGGAGFSLYQMRPAGIDGRGVGWHHIGDFDDWSTEALSYRADASRLDMQFTVRDERASTALARDGNDLVLHDDPRGFWHVRRYKDGGPSFGALPMVRTTR